MSNFAPLKFKYVVFCFVVKGTPLKGALLFFKDATLKWYPFFVGPVVRFI